MTVRFEQDGPAICLTAETMGEAVAIAQLHGQIQTHGHHTYFRGVDRDDVTLVVHLDARSSSVDGLAEIGRRAHDAFRDAPAEDRHLDPSKLPPLLDALAAFTARLHEDDPDAERPQA